jgi:hypothetical protein
MKSQTPTRSSGFVVAADDGQHRRLWLIKGPPLIPSSFVPDGWAAASEEISDDNLLWRSTSSWLTCTDTL